MQSDAKRLQALQLLVLLLPAEHSTLLRRLLNLLHRVVDEAENRMTADNLAILFVPHIIVSRKVRSLQATDEESLQSQKVEVVRSVERNKFKVELAVWK